MDIEIDVSSSEAVYEQIVRQIQDGVRQGALEPGAPLPSIRQLAGDLDLNPNTVAKAYKILETSSVIVTAGRKGTFVHGQAPARVHQKSRQDAADLVEQLISTLQAKGLALKQIEAMFRAAIKERSAD